MFIAETRRDFLKLERLRERRRRCLRGICFVSMLFANGWGDKSAEKRKKGKREAVVEYKKYFPNTGHL